MLQLSELTAGFICCQANVLGMVQDIADCLVWAQESGPKFNFDKVRNILKYSSEIEEIYQIRMARLTIYYKPPKGETFKGFMKIVQAWRKITILKQFHGTFTLTV